MVRRLLTTVLEVCGYGMIAAGVWVLWGPGAGLVASGVALVAVAYGVEHKP